MLRVSDYKPTMSPVSSSAIYDALYYIFPLRNRKLEIFNLPAVFLQPQCFTGLNTFNLLIMISNHSIQYNIYKQFSFSNHIVNCLRIVNHKSNLENISSKKPAVFCVFCCLNYISFDNLLILCFTNKINILFL